MLVKYSLHPVAGFAPGIGFSLAALEEVRQQLREAVKDMSDEDIARRAAPGTHTIGALILHIGEAEWWWMNCIVQGQEVTDEVRRQPYWDVLEEPDAFATKNYSASFCLDTIDAIREETRRFLASLTDGDLENIYARRTNKGRFLALDSA